MDERQECSTLEIKDNQTKCSWIPNTPAKHGIVKHPVKKVGFNSKKIHYALCFARYTLEDFGSGSHVHISLPQNGENVFMAGRESSEHKMSTSEEEFRARVLDQLPSILAFTAQVPNSYDGIQPITWSVAYLRWETKKDLQNRRFKHESHVKLDSRSRLDMVERYQLKGVILHRLKRSVLGQ